VTGLFFIGTPVFLGKQSFKRRKFIMPALAAAIALRECDAGLDFGPIDERL
jgi:hypothetical protein